MSTMSRRLPRAFRAQPVVIAHSMGGSVVQHDLGWHAAPAGVRSHLRPRRAASNTLVDRGTGNRTAAERGADRRRLLRDAVRRPREAGTVRRCDERSQCRHGQAIAEKFPWRDYSSVIDIGCAEGAVSVAIARAHEHLIGGGFDLRPSSRSSMPTSPDTGSEIASAFAAVTFSPTRCRTPTCS